MGLDKNGYYTLRDIDKYKCAWNLIYGDRAPGKSFAVKKRGLEHAIETGKPVIGIIRRNKADVTPVDIEAYWTDRDINVVEEVTHGEWTFISYYRGFMWLARTQEQSDGTVKIIRGQAIGEVFALSTAKHHKSTGHPHIDYIIYEEIITDECYLRDEPNRLQQLISTICRKSDYDDGVRIYLIGNTLSRVCPYFAEWNLKNIRKQKIGTIDRYDHETSEGEIIHMAVEYCPPSPHKSKLFFGRAAKSIQGGAWQTGEYPHLPEPLEKYSECYTCTYISIDRFMFAVKLLCHDNDGYLVVFIYPGKVPAERVISSAYSTDVMQTPQIQPDIYPAEKLIADCFKNNKVVYSDNQAAQDFIDSCKAELHAPFIVV